MTGHATTDSAAGGAYERIIGFCDREIESIDGQTIYDQTASYWNGQRVAFIRVRDAAIRLLEKA